MVNAPKLREEKVTRKADDVSLFTFLLPTLPRRRGASPARWRGAAASRLKGEKRQTKF